MFFSFKPNFNKITFILQQQLGEYLKSAIRYQEFLGNTKHHVILLILKEENKIMWDRIHNLKLHPHVDVKIFFEPELLASTDVFPLEFLEIQKSHVLLCGEDIVRSITLDASRVRLQCEFYFRSTLLKVRKAIVNNIAPKKIIHQSWPIFLKVLQYLLEDQNPIKKLERISGKDFSFFKGDNTEIVSYLEGLSQIVDYVDKM